MDKCYRVVYTNKDGETLAGIWTDKKGAIAELIGPFYGQARPVAYCYNELDLTVDILYNVTHAEIQEL